MSSEQNTTAYAPGQRVLVRARVTLRPKADLRWLPAAVLSPPGKGGWMRVALQANHHRRMVWIGDVRRHV